MKRQLKKRFGAVMAFAGLFAAICTMDGSAHELLVRSMGVAAFAIGAWLAEAYDFQDKKQEEYDRREDHDPYPEEMAEHPVGEIQQNFIG